MPPAMARIVFTLEDGVEIETEMDADVITVGRHPDSIVVLPSASVSSHHATIKRRGDAFYVQDLGTTNGTKLNGVEVEEAKLQDGDKVTFGDIPGIVHLTDAPVVPRSTLPVPDPPIVASTPVPSMSSRRRKGAQKRSSVPQYKESTGCASFLIFLLLMAIAFIVGLHIRHAVHMGDGNVLFIDVVKKLQEKVVEQPDAAPVGGDKAGANPAPGAAPAPPVENK